MSTHDSETPGPPTSSGPLPFFLARALRLYVEAEQIFGLDVLPRVGHSLGDPVAHRDVSLAEEQSQRNEPPNVVAAPTPAVHTLEQVAADIAACRACGLHEVRLKTVPGQGHPRARLMFIGEAPGAQENQTGLAFVGRAGELLTKMIEAMGLSRDQVFIANVLKCRPPENRDPAPEEVAACFHFLLDQIDLVQPDVICTLGVHATRNLLKRSEPISRLRGRVFTFGSSRVIPTFHPSYLLQNPEKKREAWADLKVVMRELGLLPPTAGS